MGTTVLSRRGSVAGGVVLVGGKVSHPMLWMLCEGYVGAGVGGAKGQLVGIGG